MPKEEKSVDQENKDLISSAFDLDALNNAQEKFFDKGKEEIEEPKDEKEEEKELEEKKEEKQEDQEEKEEEEKDPEKIEYTETELEAMKHGWTPKDKFLEKNGDPDNWVSAKRWLKEKRSFDELDALRKAQRRSDEQNMMIIDILKQLSEKNEKTELNSLIEARREAISNADVEKVEELDKKIDEIKSSTTKIKSLQSPKDYVLEDETKAFIERNKHWFNKESQDDPITNHAREYANFLDKSRPNMSIREKFLAVEDEVAKIFNVKIVRDKEEKKTTPTAAPKTYVPRNSSKNNGIKANDLPKELRGMAQRFAETCNRIDRSGKKGYTADYFANLLSNASKSIK